MKTTGIKKLIPAALSAVLAFGGVSGNLVANASPVSTSVQASYGQFQVKLTADPATDTPPTGSDGFGTMDSAGRIWTDKSVTAGSDGSFGVKLSALAQEYMTIDSSANPGVGSDGSSNAPAADVTFILDMSQSMGSLNNKEIAEVAGQPGKYYRVEAMAKAANEAIRTVMNANPNNRVAVYWFGGLATTASHLGTMLELGHYTLDSGHAAEDYLNYAFGSDGTITPNKFLIKDNSGSAIGTQTTVTLGGGTPTQDGIMFGVSKTIKNAGTKGTGPKRQPYVFILSDGAAIDAKKEWYTSPKGKSFENDYDNALTDAVTILNYQKPGASDDYVPKTSTTSLANTGDPAIAALTILTGAYMKKLIEDKYTAYNGESTSAKFYTVGLGKESAINGPYNSSAVYAWAGLDPKKVQENQANSGFRQGSAVNTFSQISTYATYDKNPADTISAPSNVNYASAFAYSDYYTFAPTYDIVKGAFDGLASDVQASTTILPLLNIPKSTELGDSSETADMASAIVISDEIGDGFEVDLSTLAIGNAVATVDAGTPIIGGTAYQFAGYGSKAVVKTVGDVTTLTWYIDAEDMQSHIYRFTNRTSPAAGQYTAPANGTFALNYKVKPVFSLSPANVTDTAYYLNSGDVDHGAKSVAYFSPPEDSPYYDTSHFTATRTVDKTNGIGATYVYEESLSDNKVTMKLGNNGRLDLEMGVVKTGPATARTGGNINYEVKVYNYTDTDKTGLSVASDGDTPQTGITVPHGDSKTLTFHATAPITPQTLTSNQAVVSGNGPSFSSNTVDTDVTDVIAYTVTPHVVGNVGGSASGGGDDLVDGDSTTLTATPDPGYVFEGWYGDADGTGTRLSPDATYSFTVHADGDYYAKFNAIPVASDDVYRVMKGETLNVAAANGILSNDTDLDNDTLSAVDVGAIDDSAKGTLTEVNSDGSFTFAALTSGSATFTYNAYDGISKSNQATVTLNILKPSVVGSVYDRDNDVPVFGATVVLIDPDNNDEQIATTTTNEDGDYVFDDVAAGNYDIKVTGPGFSPAHRGIVVSTATGDANGVVTEDFLLVGFEIILTADPASILGNGIDTSDFTAVVIDKDHNPQAGVEVVFEVPDIVYGHFANGTNTITAVTGADGSATVTFASEAFGGETQTVPLKATVNDSDRDLYAADTILITFNPGAIVGIVTDQEGNPVSGAKVEVSKDFGGGDLFYASKVTGPDGRYTIGIPKGDENYDVFITKPVTVGGVVKQVTFNQSVTVSGSSGGKTFEANKTASGIVLIGTSGGSSTLNGSGGGYLVEITDAGGTQTFSGSIDGDGVFNIDNVPSGNYTAAIIYQIPLPGGGTAPVVIGHADVTINSSGQISISEVLIDPYGTISDSSTHDPISGVTVVLHYSDGTTVALPPLPGFPPADNANPQTSDAAGQYAFMVFPHTDYYITATKTGYYRDFDSRVVDPLNPLIHVGTDIVRYDFSMVPLGGGTPVVTGPTVPVTEPAEPAQSVDLATAILADKMKAGEGDTVTFTVIYANRSAFDTADAYVKVNIPSGMTVADANGGVVTGNEIKWSLGKLAGGAKDKLTYKLKVDSMSKGEDFAVATAAVGSDKDIKLINPQDDTSLIKLLMYSNRFEHKHKRYITGYPDGTVKPERLITRAEVAAIFARTLELQGEVRNASMYSDVDTGYWGAEYIETVSARGIFKGYADGSFRPDKPITRAELASAIARYLGVAKETPLKDMLRISPLTDISGNWAEQSLDELYRFGIVSGYGDDSFRPNNPITREEAVKMINSMLYRGPLEGADPSYPDNLVDKWSFGQVEEATRTHISKFNADGSETMTEYISEPLW